MQQFFTDEKIRIGKPYTLPDSVVFQLQRVLRYRGGETIRLVDAEGHVFFARVEWKKRGGEAVAFESPDEHRELSVSVTLALAPIKRDRWEWALQKATELGVQKIVPLVTHYTNSPEHFTKNRREREERIIREAAEQSERHRIPELCAAVCMEDFIRQGHAESFRILCAERREKSAPMLSSLFAETDFHKYSAVEILIGPEGGFTDEEVETAVESGVQAVSLGPRILRAETAAMLACGMIAQHLEAVMLK